MSLIIPTGYHQQKATPSPRGSCGSRASPGLHGSGFALRFTSAPCAPLAHRVGKTPASAPLRRPLTAYGGSSHSFTYPYTAHGLACATSPLGLVLTTVRLHPLSDLSVPGFRPFYLFGGGGFGSSSRGRRCGRRHGSRCPCLPSGGAPTPRPRSPAPFGRALPSVGLRGERLKPFLSATRSQCQTWLVSSTKPQRRGLNGSLGTPRKPCLPCLRHYRHRFCGGA